jgi:hypothetical protein
MAFKAEERRVHPHLLLAVTHPAGDAEPTTQRRFVESP